MSCGRALGNDLLNTAVSTSHDHCHSCDPLPEPTVAEGHAALCVTCLLLLIGRMSIELRAETVLSASVGSAPWNEIPTKRLGTNSHL